MRSTNVHHHTAVTSKSKRGKHHLCPAGVIFSPTELSENLVRRVYRYSKLV
jgi:hypothetical protein